MIVRRVLAFGVAALLLTAAESAFRAGVGMESVALHLALGLVLYLAVNAGALDGALSAAVVGYAWDVFSGAPVGPYVTLAVALFVMVRLASQTFDLVGGPSIAVVGVGGELFMGVAVLVLLGLGRPAGAPAFGTALVALGWQAVVAGMLAPMGFRLGGFLDRLVGAESGEQEVWLQ